jgi:hypothetical protein
MTGPQGGIFALGSASHAYLEFDLVDERDGAKLVGAIAALREPRTTMGGVNLVSGFSPELWRAVAPEDAPENVGGFADDIVGVDGFVMPATQHDAVLWLSGSAYDVIFDTARAAIAELETLASIAEDLLRGQTLADAHAGRLARGHLPIDLRDDQPEPRRREASGGGLGGMAVRSAGGEAERAVDRSVQADLGAHG